MFYVRVGVGNVCRGLHNQNRAWGIYVCKYILHSADSQELGLIFSV